MTLVSRQLDRMICDVLSGFAIGVNGIAVDDTGGEVRFIATIRPDRGRFAAPAAE